MAATNMDTALSALIAIYLFRSIGRAERMECQVVERTEDLSFANAELEQEITERRQAEATLQIFLEQERKTHSTLEATLEAMWQVIKMRLGK